MSRKTETVARTFANLALEKIHMGTNAARDTIGGSKGHSQEDIAKLAFLIEETGYVVEPISVGPLGYRDEKFHPDTPEGKHPLNAGYGRYQAVCFLRSKYPDDSRWKTIPAIIEGAQDAKSAAMINLVENFGNDQTSIGVALTYQHLQSVGLKSVQQVASMAGVSPAEVTNYVKLLRLPAHIQELLVQAEKNQGLWTAENKGERAGKKYNKPTATYLYGAIRRIDMSFKTAGKVDVSDTEYAAGINALYSDWEKTGIWDKDYAPLTNWVNGILAKMGKEPIEGRAKAKTEEPTPASGGETAPRNTAPATNGGTTPGNGKDQGMGRADQSGTPRDVNGPPVRESKDGKEEYYPLLGAGLALAQYLVNTGIPSLKAIGETAIRAYFGKTPNGTYGLSPASVTALDNVLKEHFPQSTTATASNG